MKKLWEEEWAPEEVIVMHNRHDGQKEAREYLGHAAPDMARALLAVLTCQNKGPCRTCEMTIRSALAKAGVPLP